MSYTISDSDARVRDSKQTFVDDCCGTKKNTRQFVGLSAHLLPCKWPTCGEKLLDDSAKVEHEVKCQKHPLYCTYCTSVAVNAASLEAHSMECPCFPHTCEVCKKRFQSSAALRGHKRVHVVTPPKRKFTSVDSDSDEEESDEEESPLDRYRWKFASLCLFVCE